MQKLLHIVRIAVLDILVAGLIVVTFAFFHHVLPSLKTSAAEEAAPVARPQPVATVKPVEKTEGKTEWQIKFADKFSDEVISTATSYKSPEVSIELKTVSYPQKDDVITYHVADIYIASIENFATYTANNQVKYFDTQDALEMDKAADAILSMSGDFITYQQSGFIVRNGQLYMEDEAFCDICVLYPDGSMETLRQGDYTMSEVLAKNPSQIWNFGPMLIDEKGEVNTNYDVSAIVSKRNPRSAIGYFEPGHYCFVVADGRQEGHSAGMLLPELGQLFLDLGCSKAYNLDGGGSAVMIFGDEHYSSMSNGGGRELGDILLIRESGEVQ